MIYTVDEDNAKEFSLPNLFSISFATLFALNPSSWTAYAMHYDGEQMKRYIGYAIKTRL